PVLRASSAPWVRGGHRVLYPTRPLPHSAPWQPDQPVADRGPGRHVSGGPGSDLESAGRGRVAPGSEMGGCDRLTDRDLGSVGDDRHAVTVVEVAERRVKDRIGSA